MKKGFLFMYFIYFTVVFVHASQTVTIDTPKTVNQNNVHDFYLSGNCSENGYPVYLTGIMAGKSISFSQRPICSNGKWQVTTGGKDRLDLTPFTTTSKDNLLFKVEHYSHSWAKANASAYADYTFFCTEGFVPVPYHKDFYPLSQDKSSFCIAKYEMTPHPDYHSMSLSKGASGLPLKVVHQEAFFRCKALGDGYDLINNRDWQMVARNLELVDSNWTEGAVGAGILYTGVNGSPTALETNLDDINGSCFWGKRNACHLYKEENRTHTLSNGFVLWDLAGNESEWLKDRLLTRTSDSSISLNDYFLFEQMYNVTNQSHPKLLELWEGEEWGPRIKLRFHYEGGEVYLRHIPIIKGTGRDLFGPIGDYPYTAPSEDDLMYGRGLGGLDIFSDEKPTGELLSIARGGDSSSGTNTGIFAIEGNGLEGKKEAFRCTFRPEAKVVEKEIDKYKLPLYEHFGKSWEIEKD